MTTITLSDILDDLCVAEEGLHKFERRYWISSNVFYDLYSRGLLDDGETWKTLPNGQDTTNSNKNVKPPSMKFQNNAWRHCRVRQKMKACV